jgi:hypothetical protein
MPRSAKEKRARKVLRQLVIGALRAGPFADGYAHIVRTLFSLPALVR